MEISVEKLLLKMADEVSKARSEVEKGKLRERLIAIRTLCDVILDDKVESEGATPNKSTHFFQASVPQKMVHTEDGDGNGDSLFDF